MLSHSIIVTVEVPGRCIEFGLSMNAQPNSTLLEGYFHKSQEYLHIEILEKIYLKMTSINNRRNPLVDHLNHLKHK